jgi:hypothetical protein
MASATQDRRMGLTGDKAIKAPVRCATTANITLSGYQTIDGITLAAGDTNLRVLVKNQTSAVDNGIWDAGSGAWTRAIDCNGTQDLVTGTSVKIISGTTYANTFWSLTTTGDILPGTTSQAWAVFLDGATSAAAAAVSAATATAQAAIATAQAAIATAAAATSHVLQDNPIINRDHDVCQNGSPIVAAADGAILTDHYIYNKIGGMVHTLTQDTDVPTVAQAGRKILHSYRATLTTADNSIAATDECVIVQKLEGFRFKRIAQQANKIAFWVKATLPGTYAISLRNDVPDQSCVIPFTINSALTYEQKILDMPATPAAGTWCYDDTGAGLRFGIVLVAGSTYLAGSANAWLPGYFHCVAGQINGVQTGATDFWFTDADIYPAAGSPNAPRYYDEEQHLCRRIRKRFTGFAVGDKILHGVVTSATAADFSYDGDMREINAVTYSGALNLIDGVSNYAVTAMTFVGSKNGTVYFTVTCSGGGMTAGRAAEIRFAATTDYIDISGEF